MRLIDWDKVLEWMHRQKETTEQWSMRIAIENYVDDMPTVDAVEVVRCKDCIHRMEDGMCEYKDYRVAVQDDNDFCSWGERREDGAERK